jgi:hypothetical protein
MKSKCKAEKQAVFPTHSAFEAGKTHPQKRQNIAFSALMLCIYSISGLKYSINECSQTQAGKNRHQLDFTVKTDRKYRILPS